MILSEQHLLTVCQHILLCAAAVPMYLRHFLNGQAPGGSWRRSLASAMHSRIRAMQQQRLPPVVLLPSNLPPLFPTLASKLDSTSRRKLSTLGLPDHSQMTSSTPTFHSQERGRSGLDRRAREQPASTADTGSWKSALSNGHAAPFSVPLQIFAQPSSSPAASCGSYAAALQSQGNTLVGSDVSAKSAVGNKANKRKVPDLGGLNDQSGGPVKRPVNSLHPSLLLLEEETAQLQKLMQDSDVTESLVDQ